MLSLVLAPDGLVVGLSIDDGTKVVTFEFTLDSRAGTGRVPGG